MVQIVTDSSVLYTEEETKAAGFDVIPLCVSVGDMDGRDLQIDMEEFYGRTGVLERERFPGPPSLPSGMLWRSMRNIRMRMF